MMDAEEALALGDALDALEAKLDGGQAVVTRFASELSGLEGQVGATRTQVAGLSRQFGGSLRRAFDAVVFDGAKLSDALSGLARSMVNAAYGTAMKPVQDALGGAMARGVSALMPFAEGGTFAQGRVMPFARGGVVSQATAFPMRGGTGLMGEAGPEAIMPLRRGPDGRLGVEMAGGPVAPVTVTMNISTPDAASFRRSRTQVAAEMSRALARGARNR
jgi:lambda family phage tail tape measure protein